MILLDASIVDCFICGVIPGKRRVVSWQLQSVAILAYKRTLQNTRTSIKVSHLSKQAVDHNVNCNVKLNNVRAARQFELLADKQQHVLDTTKLHGNHTIEPRAMLINRHCTLDARGIIGTTSEQPLHNFISNLSSRQIRLTTCIVVAYCSTSSDILHSVNFSDQKYTQLGLPR